MPRARVILARSLIGCAALAAGAGCGRQVHLGDIGDGGAALLWTATFEPGDLSEWVDDGGGGTYVDNSAGVPSAIALAFAHRGRYAGMVRMMPVMGAPSLSYLYRQHPSPEEAYYSAWYYIPSSVIVRSWLSLAHFRGSPSGSGNDLVPLWDVNVYPRLDGTLVAHLYNYTTVTNTEELFPVVVPVDTWVQFEVLFRKASDQTGRIAVWQDGVPVIDLTGVATAPTDFIQWDAGGSSTDIVPSSASIYIDDAAISLVRVGPGP